MAPCCEVCGAAATPPARLRRLRVEGRLLTLCDGHAAEARGAGATGLSGLRALFREPEGRRSLLGRRTFTDRRVFPPRPEGRRRAGRRAGDAEE